MSNSHIISYITLQLKNITEGPKCLSGSPVKGFTPCCIEDGGTLNCVNDFIPVGEERPDVKGIDIILYFMIIQ